MRDRLRRAGAERGSILPLVIGFGVSLVMLSVVVLDTSQAWIYRRTLHSIADGASLDAANSLDPAVIYGDGVVGDTVALSEPIAQQAVNDYVAALQAIDTGHADDVDCAVDVAGGDEVTVTCTGEFTLPILGFLSNDLATQEMSGSATAQTRSVG